jgi:hypothetical protein
MGTSPLKSFAVETSLHKLGRAAMTLQAPDFEAASASGK